MRRKSEQARERKKGQVSMREFALKREILRENDGGADGVRARTYANMSAREAVLIPQFFSGLRPRLRDFEEII